MECKKGILSFALALFALLIMTACQGVRWLVGTHVYTVCACTPDVRSLQVSISSVHLVGFCQAVKQIT